jgi:hypothetical protein
VSPSGYTGVQIIDHLFLAIFLMQADFRTIGEFRFKLPLLFLSGISDLDLCLAHRAFPLNLAFGRYIGIDHSGVHTPASSPRACVHRTL